MALKFFNLPKPRQFDFKPRYWNPDKEDREERVRQIREELGMKSDPADRGNSGNYRPYIRGQFRRAMRNSSRTTPDARRQSNKRLLVIIGILLLIFYFLFYR